MVVTENRLNNILGVAFQVIIGVFYPNGFTYRVIVHSYLIKVLMRITQQQEKVNRILWPF